MGYEGTSFNLFSSLLYRVSIGGLTRLTLYILFRIGWVHGNKISIHCKKMAGYSDANDSSDDAIVFHCIYMINFCSPICCGEASWRHFQGSAVLILASEGVSLLPLVKNRIKKNRDQSGHPHHSEAFFEVMLNRDQSCHLHYSHSLLHPVGTDVE
jgi:hypothetical protein